MTTATLRRMVRAMIEATGWPASAAADAVAENLAADDETRERLTKIAEEIEAKRIRDREGQE